jgi:RimJ/RimL family protein N-acetyltransferase
MPFPLQPTFHGSLVHLRPLRENDFATLCAVASDPLIWEQHPANDRWKPDVFRRYFDEGMASGGAFLVTDAATGAVIGCTRYANYDEEASEIEIGWTFLARSHWGGRYNGEMKALMLRHAFQHVESVLFHIGVNNMRSQNAVRKIGAVLEGTCIAAGVESQLWRARRSLPKG